MADPLFLTRLLAAAAVAAMLVLCAGNATDHEPAAHPHSSTSVAGR
jgi:hypothetical protein